MLYVARKRSYTVVMEQVLPAAQRRSISIGVVDNDPYALPLLTAAIERLDAAFHVIWTARTGAVALHQYLFDRAPQVMVIDMALTDMSGIQICQTIRRRTAATGIVGITALDPQDFASDLNQAGAQALVAKDAIPTLLRPAILAAASGEPYNPDLSAGNAQSTVFHSAQQTHQELLHRSVAAQLSSQERLIMRLYQQGFTTGQIAHQLGVSAATIYVHVHHVMKKTGTSSRREALVRCAAQLNV